ncbi:maleylpyruvate isomerase family mycothiol-dependent enzyme [Nocardioides sp. GY 10113]|uniref:maleylpyruvate isomerase family mycothiol-dependent enzyme n=1 Tax=Nocardioides sp. GY 10113 TaxID=2569761 RepID=UPI0010A79F65|nr:maleylpyruvate isomerase family mycothiol-dependent enzyme [Nocardioides sp. GY 10113]TIC86312.1 maleylpyruvate isomerase family mycothiol-dependent enzyme [Nocardioides sp. GY 10113]
MLDAREWTDLLASATSEFAAVLADGDLDAGVPACPDWTLADLADHLRGVHLWAAHAITEGDPKGTAPPVALDREALVPAYREAAERLLTVLRTTGAHDPAWTFGPEHTASFWFRRQVHETTLHLYDALASQGRGAEWRIDPALAWDGVAEVATMFYPRQVRLGRTEPMPGTLRLIAPDVDETVDLGEGEPYGVVAGPAADVLRVLWKRLPAGDEVADQLLRATAVTP